MTDLIGEQFKIIRELGRGGQGKVYLVKSTLDKKDYALKILENQTDGTIRRFEKEIASLKEIDSPFVVNIISENISDKKKSDTFYYAMEYAKFGTLYNNNYYVKDLRLCLGLFRKICLGVKAIHDKDLIHRDLKPSNILLMENQRDIKISDFGLSYELNKTAEEITGIREKVGAMYFSAPEQTSLPSNPTKKSDIFSLGKILYFMITGRKSQNLEESLSVKDFVSDEIVDKVDDLINNMSAYQPKDRIGSVDEIIKIIDDLQGNTSAKSEFTLTVLQFRILKFIRSFEYKSVSFDEIFGHVSSFYNIRADGGIMSSYNIMFSGSRGMTRSELIDKIETALETFEKKGTVEFKEGKYNYLSTKENEDMFKQYV